MLSSLLFHKVSFVFKFLFTSCVDVLTIFGCVSKVSGSLKCVEHVVVKRYKVYTRHYISKVVLVLKICIVTFLLNSGRKALDHSLPLSQLPLTLTC